MLNKKVLVAIIMAPFLTLQMAGAAYDTVECSSDAVFSENSCNQCFTGGAKGEGDHLSFLTDEWVNEGTTDQVLFKEAQTMPEMKNLGGDNVSWIQTPDSKDFWEYPEEFNALYSDNEEGYVLKAGQRVTWLKSKLAYAYKLEKNKAEAGSNIGLLVYPISVLNLVGAGEPLADDLEEHKECVLFTSGEASDEAVAPAIETERLPDTGPAEYMILLILAMILGFGFLQLRTKS